MAEEEAEATQVKKVVRKTPIAKKAAVIKKPTLKAPEKSATEEEGLPKAVPEGKAEVPEAESEGEPPLKKVKSKAKEPPATSAPKKKSRKKAKKPQIVRRKALGPVVSDRVGTQ